MSRMSPDLSPPEPEVDQTLAGDLFYDLSGAENPADDYVWEKRLIQDITIVDGNVGDKTMWAEVDVLVTIRVPITVDEFEEADGSCDIAEGGGFDREPEAKQQYETVKARVLAGAQMAQDAVYSRMKSAINEGAFNV